jgi:predicted GIY-YIG superfamily endonuclease
MTSLGSTYVYIMESGTGKIRVGMTSNINRRKSNINSGSASLVNVVWNESFKTRDEAKEMERIVHDKLKRFHSHGSWYFCSATEALEILDPPYPRSLWPKGSRFRPPPMICSVPLPASIVEEDLKLILGRLTPH